MIIAEAGVNHNGDVNRAKELIVAAAEAGVDFVKFQTFQAEKLVNKTAKKADYQMKNLNDGDDSQYAMLKKLELSHDDHLELIKYCKSKNVRFFSTAFDLDGLDYLLQLGFDHFKIPSGEITNYPYLKKVASFRKPVILSTGMANLKEIEDALEVLTSEGLSKNDITVLHCNTEYPTPMQDVNLLAMRTIETTCGVQIGYSDHTLGIEVPIAAVALGARVIEKHFTLDRTLPGPDHKASLEPDELKAMVEGIRNIELAMSGDGSKRPSASESKNLDIVRKSIHLKNDKRKGDVILKEDLTILRPGTGISPMKFEDVLGQKVKRDIKAFSILQEKDLC